MRQYIKKLQSKKIETRKQILAGAMVITMSFVLLIWVYGLGVRFGDPKVKVQSQEDIKPFKLFSNSISDTYKTVSASVGKAPNLKKVDNAKEKEPEKQVNLIPVEYPN